MSERRCSICGDPKKNEWVARRHLEGFSAHKMEEMARAQGHPMKRETIKKHLKVCLGTEATPAEVKAVAEKVSKVVAPAPDSTEDVAVLVQREVVRKLKNGEGRVTVQHGLQAQQLLDRRAERAKDRELAITLARLLHSPAPPPRAVTERVEIEGQFVEVGRGDDT